MSRTSQPRHACSYTTRDIRQRRGLDLTRGDDLLTSEWKFVGAGDGLSDNILRGDASGEEGSAGGGEEGGDDGGVPAGVDDCYAEL